MESSLSSSSDSDRVTPPIPYRSEKRRRADEAPDEPIYDQAIQQHGFFTIREEYRDVRRTEFHLSKAEAFVERVRVGYKPR